MGIYMYVERKSKKPRYIVGVETILSPVRLPERSLLPIFLKSKASNGRLPFS